MVEFTAHIQVTGFQNLPLGEHRSSLELVKKEVDRTKRQILHYQELNERKKAGERPNRLPAIAEVAEDIILLLQKRLEDLESRGQ